MKYKILWILAKEITSYLKPKLQYANYPSLNRQEEPAYLLSLQCQETPHLSYVALHTHHMSPLSALTSYITNILPRSSSSVSESSTIFKFFRSWVFWSNRYSLLFYQRWQAYYPQRCLFWVWIREYPSWTQGWRGNINYTLFLSLSCQFICEELNWVFMAFVSL